MAADKKLLRQLLKIQKNEITEYMIYKKLALVEKDAHNRAVLERIASDELGHYDIWKHHTGMNVAASGPRVLMVTLMAKVLGLNFALKLMERSGTDAQKVYARTGKAVPDATLILRDEKDHENEILGMIDEERLKYAGTVVLGLNDALVELTGALAGLTLALQDVRLIALTGLITGAAASLSTAASSFLSARAGDGLKKSAFKSAVATGITYALAVAVLIAPFFIFSDPLASLAVTLAAGLLITAAFNFYLSVAKGLSFSRRFAEMALVSLSVTAISFGIGYLLKTIMNVDV